jgi:hypothetical protein
VQTIAARNNAKVEEVVDYYQKNNLFDQMAIEILERKVRTLPARGRPHPGPT